MRKNLRSAVAAQAGRGLGHPGLVLDRYLGDAGDPGERAWLLKAVADAGVAPGYRLRYKRWRDALLALSHTRLAIFQTAGRLVAGLGNESVHETGLALQHVDGAPYLPGSALKGLAGHYLLHQVRSGKADVEDGERHHRVLFGATDRAGYVIFFDAWYVPRSAPDDRPLALDTITVHHPDYYAGRGRQAPWDLDDPNPVPFLSVRGKFLVAIRGPDAAWAGFALDVLQRALADWGAGAKTSSGYGRLVPVDDVAPAAATGAAQTGEHAPSADHPLVQAVLAMQPARIHPEIGGIVQQARLLDEPQRAAVLQAVAARLQSDEALWRWAQRRPWFALVDPYAADPGARDDG
jgi:CRISPR-associated protein Cmr6